jgi:hypothetical protein
MLFERSEFVGVKKQCAENKLFILSLDLLFLFYQEKRKKRIIKLRILTKPAEQPLSSDPSYRQDDRLQTFNKRFVIAR